MRSIIRLLVYLLLGLCVEALEPADHQASLPWNTFRESRLSVWTTFSSAASYQNLYSLTPQPLATPTPTPISLTSLGELYYICCTFARARMSQGRDAQKLAPRLQRLQPPKCYLPSSRVAQLTALTPTPAGSIFCLFSVRASHGSDLASLWVVTVQ